MNQDKILSTSGINLWLSCPHSYWLKYWQKCEMENTEAEYLRLGRSGHAILEHYYEELNLEAPDLENEFTEKLKMVAFKYWDRSIDARKRNALEPALFNWIKFELQRFQNYKKQGIEDRFKPLIVEQDLTDYNLKLRAKIDKRCIGSNGDQYALDYKFDTKLPAKRNFSGNLVDIDLKYKVQAAVNATVLKTQEVEIKNFFYQFVRFPEKLMAIPLVPELFEEVNTIIKTIRADETYIKNKKGCFMCGLKASCESHGTSIHCLNTGGI